MATHADDNGTSQEQRMGYWTKRRPASWDPGCDAANPLSMGTESSTSVLTWPFEVREQRSRLPVVGSGVLFDPSRRRSALGAFRSSFFPPTAPQTGGSWRLVSRGVRKPNIMGRRLIDHLAHRWYLKDWFYGFVHMPTLRILAWFALIYLALVVMFALIYLGIDAIGGCNLGLGKHFRSAFFFSLETHATIGYGTPEPLFNECNGMLVALFSQTFCALVGDGMLISLLFARLSRGTKRAASMVFSEKAIIVEHNGDHYLLMQVFDKRRDALVEATVRVFCYIHHEFAGRRFPYSRAMRMSNPDPDDGSVLLSCSPSLLIHKLTASSPVLAAASLAGFSCNGAESLDADELVEALRKLGHFEIIVEVNGVENITTAQVQARWSYVLDEIECEESVDTCWETPDVTFHNGKAEVHRTSVCFWRNNYHNEESPDTHGQLAHALSFHIP